MDADSVREDPIPGQPEAGLSGNTSRTRLRVDPGRLQAYASWAEVVSAVAIVASLIYAGTELRRSTTMSNREADVVLFERIADAQRMIIETSGLAEIIAVAREAPAELSPADRLRYLTFQDHFFNSWEMGWHYRADGILDEDDWSEWNEWFTAEARRRPAFGWLENRLNYTSLEFQTHVDAIVSTP